MVCSLVQGDELASGVIDLGERALTGVSADAIQIATWNPAQPEALRIRAAGTGKVLYSVEIPVGNELLWVGYLGKDDFPSGISSGGRLFQFRKGLDPEVIELKGNAPRRGSIEVSADGSKIAYAGNGARIWEAKSGNLLGSTADDSFLFASFTDSGEKAVFLSYRSAYVWSEKTGSISRLDVRFPDDLYYGIRSQTGRYAAAPSRERIEIIDLEQEKAEYVEASPGASAIFGQADTELAVLHGADRGHQVDIWNIGAALDDLTFRRNYLSKYEHVSTYSDGQVLSCDLVSNLEVVLHDIEKGESKKLMSECKFFQSTSVANEATINVMQIFGKNSRVAIASARGMIGLWDLNTRHQFVNNGYGRGGKIESVRSPSMACLGAVSIPSLASSFRPVGNDGSMIVECSNRQVYLIGGEICFPKVPMFSLKFERGGPGKYDDSLVDFTSRGDRVSVVTSTGAFIIGTKDGEITRSLPGNYFLGKFDDSDERLFLLGPSAHGLGDIKTGQFLPLGAFGAPTGQLSGKRLVTGFYVDGNSKSQSVVEASTGKVINTIKFESLANTSVRLSDDGKTICAVGRRSDAPAGIELVDIASGKTIISMDVEGGFISFCKAINDGRMVAVGSNRGVSFYDARRRRLQSIIPAHPYWLENHPDSGLKYPGVATYPRHNDPTTDKEDLNGDVSLHSTQFFATHADICESRKLCLITEWGRTSLWNYETGKLLWLTYGVQNLPIQAILSRDGMKAAVLTDDRLQVFDLSSLSTDDSTSP